MAVIVPPTELPNTNNDREYIQITSETPLITYTKGKNIDITISNIYSPYNSAGQQPNNLFSFEIFNKDNIIPTKGLQDDKDPTTSEDFCYYAYLSSSDSSTIYMQNQFKPKDILSDGYSYITSYAYCHSLFNNQTWITPDIEVRQALIPTIYSYYVLESKIDNNNNLSYHMITIIYFNNNAYDKTFTISYSPEENIEQLNVNNNVTYYLTYSSQAFKTITITPSDNINIITFSYDTKYPNINFKFCCSGEQGFLGYLFGTSYALSNVYYGSKISDSYPQIDNELNNAVWINNNIEISSNTIFDLNLLSQLDITYNIDSSKYEIILNKK